MPALLSSCLCGLAALQRSVLGAGMRCLFRPRPAPTVWLCSAEYQPGSSIKAGQVVRLYDITYHIFRGARLNEASIHRHLSAQTERSVLKYAHVFALQSTALKGLSAKTDRPLAKSLFSVDRETARGSKLRPFREKRICVFFPRLV